MLYPHNDINIVARLIGQAIHPIGGAAGIHGILYGTAASIISRQGLCVIPAIVSGIIGHQLGRSAQCLYRIPVIDAQAGGGPWQKLRDTYSPCRRNSFWVEATLLVDLPDEIIR